MLLTDHLLRMIDLVVVFISSQKRVVDNKLLLYCLLFTKSLNNRTKICFISFVTAMGVCMDAAGTDEKLRPRNILKNVLEREKQKSRCLKGDRLFSAISFAHVKLLK